MSEMTGFEEIMALDAAHAHLANKIEGPIDGVAFDFWLDSVEAAGLAVDHVHVNEVNDELVAFIPNSCIVVGCAGQRDRVQP